MIIVDYSLEKLVFSIDTTKKINKKNGYFAMILMLKYEQDPKLLEKMGSKVSAQIIKMVLKTAE